MKIEINKRQYETMIKALTVSSFIYSPMGDFVDDKYKKDADSIDRMERELLKFAEYFEFEKNVEEFDGEKTTKEEYFDKILDDLNEYDDYATFENLTKELAHRDFRNKYSQEEIQKISEEHGGYLGVPMYPFEERYYDEFNEHGYDRLHFKEDEDEK